VLRIEQQAGGGIELPQRKSRRHVELLRAEAGDAYGPQ
jgi:hypothetical protein